jgi:dTDP-4-amino-4,6-dideoxygalactose transaminase
MSEVAVPYVNLALQHEALKPELLNAVENVLNHGQFILGPEVQEFEARFASYCDVKYSVGVDNGTSALILVLNALGIGPGDEVITAPNSFLASTSCIALVGAKPVFVDVGEDLNIDPNLIEAAITSRTKAILPVHLTGRPAEMDSILKIAQEHDLYVVEDCAQAVGARFRDQKVGTFGIAGCFSLHPLKTLNAIGDGGVITTSDPQLYDRLLKARNHGLRNRDECDFWSFNNRLDTLQAAMLLVKMKYLDQWTEARRSKAAIYQDELKDVVRIPMDSPHEYSVYHTFVIQTERRDELQEFLLKQGIETKVHYPIPIHLQVSASSLDYPPGSFPKAERQAEIILSLPVYPELKDDQITYVSEMIKKFFA